MDEIDNLASPVPLQFMTNATLKTTNTIGRGAINMLGPRKRLKAKILQASRPGVQDDPGFTRRRKTIRDTACRVKRRR